MSGVSYASGHHDSRSSWYVFWWHRDFLGDLDCAPPHLGLPWASPAPLGTDSLESLEMKPCGAHLREGQEAGLQQGL